MTLAIFLGQIAVFGAIFGAAIALRLHLGLELRPRYEPATAEEEAWLRELDALQLEARHKYC